MPPRSAICALLASSCVGVLACRADSQTQAQAQTGQQPQPAPLALDLSPVELPSGAASSSPNFAVGADELHLLWMSKAKVPALMLASLPGPEDVSQWSEPRAVTHSPDLLINWADVPAAGETPSGRLVVAWPEYHGPDHAAGYGLRVAAQLEDGSFTAPWSPDEQRRGPESGFAGFAATAAGLRMFWLDGRELGEGGGTMQLRSVAIDDEGGQAGPSQIHDERTCECCKIGVAAAGEQLFAAYRDRSPDEVRDIYIAGPGLAPARVAEDGWTINGCPVNGPAVAGVGARAHVAWFTGANDRSAAWVASGAPGAGFGAPQRFDLGTPGGRVDLLATPDGGAVASWLEYDSEVPGRARLLARRVGPDTKLGPAVEVAELGAGRDWGFAKAALRGDRVLWVFTRPDVSGGPSRLDARLGPLPPAP